MKKLSPLLFMSLILLMTDCREPFLPDFETGKNDYLVVEGFINVGEKGVTSITLSRVSPLMEKNQVFENDALIFIENKEGAQYPLHLVGTGNYKSDSLNLNTAIEHRLLITVGENQYASDYEKPKMTPLIDNVYWRREVEGMRIYVATHDPENKTQYYKWDFKETWEVRSSYRSYYSYSGGMLLLRGDPAIEKMYSCFKSAIPADLRFGSTVQLDEDRINYPLTLFGHYSDRTSVRYSILVEQRALSKGEFDYLQLIQKNAAIKGSLFDPLPSEIKGNIHSLINPDEQVLGFIGAYSSNSKRIFVTNVEFGVGLPAKCESVQVSVDDYEELYGSGLLIPIDTLFGAPAYCMDCKHQGATSNRPDFWK